MRKLGLALVLAALCAAALGAGRADASPYALYGIQDDAWIRYGDGSVTERAMQLKSMGVGIVRYTLRWDEVAAARPGNARNPGDPKYRWSAYDEIFGALRAAKIPVVVTIYGAPRWTNGGRAPNWAPTTGSTIASFAYAAQLRYPWIHDWTIWNEPNKPIFLRPTSPVVYTARLLNPAYAALHSASRSAKVAGGVTAPRAGSGGVSPVTWIRGDGRRARAARRLRPQPVPGEPARDAVLRRLRGVLDDHDGDARQAPARGQARVRQQADLADGVRVPGQPARPADGVSAALQARYVGRRGAAGLRGGRRRHADPLPLPRRAESRRLAERAHDRQRRRRGPRCAPSSCRSRRSRGAASRTVLWGQVRPSTGSGPYKLEQFRGGHWHWVGSTRSPARAGSSGQRCAPARARSSASTRPASASTRRSSSSAEPGHRGGCRSRPGGVEGLADGPCGGRTSGAARGAARRAGRQPSAAARGGRPARAPPRATRGAVRPRVSRRVSAWRWRAISWAHVRVHRALPVPGGGLVHRTRRTSVFFPLHFRADGRGADQA